MFGTQSHFHDNAVKSLQSENEPYFHKNNQVLCWDKSFSCVAMRSTGSKGSLIGTLVGYWALIR